MSTATAGPPIKPLRADAARNRARVLEAAQAAFAEHGTEAQMEDVARRAQVGVGTVYRHFATKEVLWAALVAQQFADTHAYVTEQLALDGDPWEAIDAVFRRNAEQALSDKCFADGVGMETFESPLVLAELDQLHPAMQALIDRGRKAGVVRKDFSSDDMPFLMCGLGRVAKAFGREGTERYLQIVLDGLRAA